MHYQHGHFCKFVYGIAQSMSGQQLYGVLISAGANPPPWHIQVDKEMRNELFLLDTFRP